MISKEWLHRMAIEEDKVESGLSAGIVDPYEYALRQIIQIDCGCPCCQTFNAIAEKALAEGKPD